MQAPPPEDWTGPGGTVSEVIKTLKLSKNLRRKVLTIISQTHRSLLVGTECDLSQAHQAGTRMIADGSEEQQMIANYRERGLSYTETTMLVNRWCIASERTTVTRSAIRTCEEHMEHEISNIEKRPQGKDDPQSNWSQCRYRWVTQLLVRLGHEPDLTDFLNEDGSIPPCFDKTLLTPLNLAGIAWWDEVHKDCFIGDFHEGTKTQTRFCRDEEGNYDPKGEFCDEKNALQVKYAKQVRFSFSVALVNKEEGVVGDRINPFYYTNKNIQLHHLLKHILKVLKLLKKSLHQYLIKLKIYWKLI